MEKISQELGCKLNYAFVNVYRDGDHLKKDHIGWHKDSESTIVVNDKGETTIASISLGDERNFQMRVAYEKGETSTSITTVKLHHGSLCTMEKQMQVFCKHQVPPFKDAKGPRVNITFRHMKII
jgi:alkylated DNA repair dioxygenase AlkB